MINNREALAALAARQRLPAIYPYSYHSESGGLVSYGSDTTDLYRRAASYVSRILHGTKPDSHGGRDQATHCDVGATARALMGWLIGTLEF